MGSPQRQAVYLFFHRSFVHCTGWSAIQEINWPWPETFQMEADRHNTFASRTIVTFIWDVGVRLYRSRWHLQSNMAWMHMTCVVLESTFWNTFMWEGKFIDPTDCQNPTTELLAILFHSDLGWGSWGDRWVMAISTYTNRQTDRTDYIPATIK